MAKRQLVGGIALCAALLSPAWADPPTTAVIGTPPQPTWSQLSIDQRVVLAPLGNEWDRMEHVRRKKWLLIAERFAKMKPEEQRRMQDRMREWALMTPEQRAKVRDSYKEFAQLPAEQKQAVKQKWETYSNLPEEEKARLKQGSKSAKTAPTEGGATLTPKIQPAAPQPPVAASNTATPIGETAKP